MNSPYLRASAGCKVKEVFGCALVSLLTVTMMKLAALALIGSATAFAPAQQGGRASAATALNAKRSVALPFMNTQPLVRSPSLSYRTRCGLSCYAHAQMHKY